MLKEGSDEGDPEFDVDVNRDDEASDDGSWVEENESWADEQEDEQEELQLFGDEYQGAGNAGAESFLHST